MIWTRRDNTIDNRIDFWVELKHQLYGDLLLAMWQTDEVEYIMTMKVKGFNPSETITAHSIEAAKQAAEQWALKYVLPGDSEEPVFKAQLGIQPELPQYRCHKVVRALKIKAIRSGDYSNSIITPEDEGYVEFEVSPEYRRKHKPEVGGYYVYYDDGYQSFSPAEAFEEGYTLIVEDS